MSTSAVRRKEGGFDKRRAASLLWRKWLPVVESMNWNARYNAFVSGLEIYPNREAAYRVICPRGPICLLEFGVYKGEGLALWTSVNKNDRSTFHGFDSFEGMREEASSPFNKGSFALSEHPTFKDRRITLHPGWFEDTVPGFNGWPGDQETTLIVSMDADQYGPTLYVLTMIDSYLRPGTIILFDQASVAQCEFRALCDWSMAYRRQYDVVAGWEYGGRVEGIAIKIKE